jgi:hypothetical protein
MQDEDNIPSKRIEDMKTHIQREKIVNHFTYGSLSSIFGAYSVWSQSWCINHNVKQRNIFDLLYHHEPFIHFEVASQYLSVGALIFSVPCLWSLGMWYRNNRVYKTYLNILKSATVDAMIKQNKE